MLKTDLTYHELRQRESLISIYKNLCFIFNGNATKTCQCVISPENMADQFRIDVDEAERVLNEMVKFGITEKQGGRYVI